MSWLRNPLEGRLFDMFGVGAAVQGATTLGAAAIQSSAINNATDAQAKSAQNSLDFQERQFNQQQANQQPYLDMGRMGMQGLANGLGLGAGGNEVSTMGLIQPTTGAFTDSYNPAMVDPAATNPGFSAPNTQTAQFDPSQVDVKSDPGYQFRLDQGLAALQRSQSATGITGGAAAKAINDYAQGAASQEYGNAYQRALSTSQQNTGINQQNYGQAQNTYATNSANNQQNYQNQLSYVGANNASNLNRYNTQQQGYTTNYNVAQQQQANQYNRLAALSGVGQTAVSQLGASGNQVAQNVAGINGQLGNAYAAGSAAQGNVWGGAMNSLGNLGGQYMQYRGLTGSPQAAPVSNPAAGSSYEDDYFYG